MMEVPPGPETLLIPPETLTESYFLEKNLVEQDLSKFIGEKGRLNNEGRKFTTELFRDLFSYCNGDYTRIKEEIKGSFNRVPHTTENLRVFQSLTGKFNWEIGLASTYVLAKQRPKEEEEKRKGLKTTLAETISAKKDFQEYFKTYCQKDISVLEEPDKEKAYLELLGQFNRNLEISLSQETGVERKRLEVMVPKSQPWLKRLNFSTPRLKKVWLTAGLAVVVGGLFVAYSMGIIGQGNYEKQALGTVGFSAAEVARLSLLGEYPLSLRAGVAETAHAEVAVGKSVISGTPTLYSKGVWEKVIENRIGKKNPLNPEIAKNPQVLAMVKDKKVAAINPGTIEKEYEETLKKEVSDMKLKGMNDTKIASELGKDKKLRELARKVIGKTIDVELPDGRHEALLVMDVFQAEHAAESMGLIKGSKVPRNFIADVHPDWVRTNLGVTWDNIKGWQDLKGASVKPPQIRLTSLS